MPTRPRLYRGSLLPGLAAVALFVVLVIVFVGAPFPGPQGFPADASITASIGYAMFDLDIGAIESAGFLAAFLLIAFVLDAALEGSVMLARDSERETLRPDGGEK